MRMKNRDRAELNWLPPSLDYMSGLVTGNKEFTGKHSWSENELNRSTNVSLNVKVDGGQKLTTPPKVTKQAKDTKKNYEGNSNSEYKNEQSPDSTEILLSSLEPYLNDEELDALDEETIRKLLNDHPELAEAAREYEEGSSKRRHGKKETKKSKPRERKRGPTTKSNASENIRYDDGNYNKISRASHMEVLMEDGIPFKSWFFLCVLIGASIFQIRKTVLEPVKSKKYSKRNGKVCDHETVSTYRRQPKKKRNSHTKNQPKKQSGKIYAKARQRNNRVQSISQDTETTKESTSAQVDIISEFPQPDTGKLKANSGKTKKQSNVPKDIANSNIKQNYGSIKDAETNDETCPKFSNSLSKNSKQQKPIDLSEPNKIDLKITTQDSLDEYCEEDRRAILQVFEEDSSRSEGEWHIAGHRHKKKKCKKYQNIDGKEIFGQKFASIKPHTKSLKANEAVQNQAGKTCITHKLNASQNTSKSDEKIPGELENFNSPINKLENIVSDVNAIKDLMDTNSLNSSNKEDFTMKKKEQEYPFLQKISSNKTELEDQTEHEDNHQNNAPQKETRDNKELIKSAQSDVISPYVNTQNDAALAVQLQREEDLLITTENRAEENWTTVTTKKNKKSSAFVRIK